MWCKWGETEIRTRFWWRNVKEDVGLEKIILKWVLNGVAGKNWVNLTEDWDTLMDFRMP